MNSEKRKELQELVLGITRHRQRHKKICIKMKKQEQIQISELKSIPLLQLGFFSFSSDKQLESFADKLQQQLNYAINKLEKPDSMLIEFKHINLQCQKSKLLLLDLDQTLIYSDEGLNDPDVELFHKNGCIRFNLRPHCRNFLKNLADIYDIFIFTSSTLPYTEPVIKYLNQGKHYIKGVLHRDHCLKTKNGYFIKDLRIIKNVANKDIVIVDNKIHSFSFQLENGIPIQEFTKNPDDKVLIFLQEFLLDLGKEEDIPKVLSDRLKLREMSELGMKNKENLRKMKIDHQNY